MKINIFFDLTYISAKKEALVEMVVWFYVALHTCDRPDLCRCQEKQVTSRIAVSNDMYVA